MRAGTDKASKWFICCDITELYSTDENLGLPFRTFLKSFKLTILSFFFEYFVTGIIYGHCFSDIAFNCKYQ